MAHEFIFPEKDTTIFNREDFLTKNSGIDEILEIEKTYIDCKSSISRALIKFDVNDIKKRILSGEIKNPKFFLNLKTVEAKNVPLKYKILAHPVSQSWEMGIGRKYDELTYEGCSWKYRDTSNGGKFWFNEFKENLYKLTHIGELCETSSNFMWSGSFVGKFLGAISSASFTGSYISASVSGSLFSGSWNGNFNGIVSGTFKGKIIGTYESCSLSSSFDDITLTSKAGGGTWYLTTQSGQYDWCDQNKTILFEPNEVDQAFETCDTGSDESGSTDTGSEDSGSNDSGSYETESFCCDGLGGYLICSQSFNYEKSDIHMDVTKIVKSWICNVIPNEGFILRHNNECDDNDYGQLRFFGMDTNTIYSPTLEIAWDDSKHEPTASVEEVDSNLSTVVYISNLNKQYKAGSKIRLDVFARERYPKKSFDNSIRTHLIRKYLPETSYYSIKDAESEEVLINFDEFTKISSDDCGNYFILNTTGFPQERYFKIYIKVETDYKVEFFENEEVFKIIR